MKSYLFEVGNSSTGHIGLCARIHAESEEEAVQRLAALIGRHTGPLDNVAILEDSEGEYIQVYINPVVFKTEDIYETEEVDG